MPARPLTYNYAIPSQEHRNEWGQSPIVRRAEFDGLVFELSENGKVYLLERNGAAPKKAGEVRMLYLIGVIDNPDLQLRVKINEKAEPYNYQQAQ